ncbi:ABC transporter permease [Actinophytocola sp.]|uniref:ABC transporter permease n=1 Tax=Actinophytocola sp. TaxID=1872138 RepID=UPI003D6BE55D
MSIRTRARTTTVRSLPTGLLLVPLFFLVLMPVGMLFYASLVDQPPLPGVGLQPLTLENYAAILSSGSLTATMHSLVLGLGGTALAMVFGGGLAWLAARTDVPGKALVQLAGITSMFMSALVGSFAWSLLASPNAGLLNYVVEATGMSWRFDIYSLPGMILVFGTYYAPYTFLFVYSALVLVNPDVEDAARVHGASTRRATTAITFPLLAPAVFGSAVLTFVLIVENFAVPQVLGSPAGITTLPSTLYRLMNLAPAEANQAAAMGFLLMVVVATVVLLQRRFVTRRSFTTVTGKGFRPRPIALGRWRWPAFGLAALYFVISVVLPFAALFQIALRRNAYIDGFAGLFDASAFSLANFQEVWESTEFQRSLQNSLVIGLATALGGGLFILVMSYVVYRTRARGRRMVEYVAMAPLAIPALVLGMGFLWTWYALPLPLYGTLAILALAFTTQFMPQGFRSISSSILQVHRDLEDSAIVAGASRLRSVREIVMPLLRSGLIGTALLLLILSMRELSAALFLFTGRTRVLSIYVFDLLEGNSGRAAAASLIYSALLLVVVLIARRWMNADRSD